MSASEAPWVEVVRQGDWTAFRGLPAGLTEAELLAGLGREASAAAGSERRPAMLGSRERDVVDLEKLRYWLDGSTVVLVQLEDPASTLPPAELVAALGPSDREGAGRYRRFGATTTEHVYATRGLALTVAESYDDPQTFEPFLGAVQLFAASDLRTFILELGGNDRGGPKL